MEGKKKRERATKSFLETGNTKHSLNLRTIHTTRNSQLATESDVFLVFYHKRHTAKPARQHARYFFSL